MRRNSKEQNKKLADDARLLRWWKAWHREQLEQALDGMHGDIMRGLMAQLKNLRSARELVAFVSARDWSRVDADTRMTALHEINQAICRMREQNGLPFADDGVPGQPDNAYRIIKSLFNSFPQQQRGGPSEHPINSTGVNDDE
jgi:hypothetical protein